MSQSPLMRRMTYNLSKHGRRRISDAVRKAWADPEKRAKRIVAMREGLRKAWTDPDKRARMINGIRAVFRHKKARAAKPSAERKIQIPKWVKEAGLTDDYVSTVAAFGEEKAASWCRWLKAEAKRGEREP
jgi:hypothetical protein